MSKRVIVDPFEKAISRMEAIESARDAIPPPVGNNDSKDLLDQARLILCREIYNLNKESVGGPLSKDSSMSLVNYIKVLREMVKEDTSVLNSFTDEELQKILKDNK